MAITFLGFLIVFAFWSISSSLDKIAENQHRYEFISTNERNVIIFDKKTGSYWHKVIDPSEGTSEWKQHDSPVTPQDKS